MAGGTDFPRSSIETRPHSPHHHPDITFFVMLARRVQQPGAFASAHSASLRRRRCRRRRCLPSPHDASEQSAQPGPQSSEAAAPSSPSTAAAGGSSDPQDAAPLLSAVLARGGRARDVPLHVPGHKRGRVVDAGMQQLSLAHDLTELAGLDYLSSPSGVIQQAQQLAAAAFGADRSWLLVNGCSVGIHAAVMAAVRPGQALLLARNCHASAFAACMLADCVPLWVQPELDAVHGVAHCLLPQQLQAGLAAAQQQGHDVGAVLVVSPTYYGAVARIAELAAVCHRAGVPLLVDEAHGGHLAFLQQDGGPAGALAAGADLVMQSSHKVLTAMTQAAMLHLQGPRVGAGRISRALQALQTSSPSYLLMASLDAARRHATRTGVWAAPLAAAASARSQLQQMQGLAVLQHGSCGSEASVAGFDPLRLVLNVTGRGWSGYAAAAWLEQQHAIVPELATSQLVVFVFGPGSSNEDARRLVDACRQLPAQQIAAASPGPPSSSPAAAAPLQQQQLAAAACWTGVLTPRQAFNAATEAVPLSAAAGRVSAELLCPYPPGVPAVFPGERFSAATVAALQQTLDAGGVVIGGQDSALAAVLVVMEDSSTL